MPCKACYAQLQSSGNALQGILCPVAVWRDAWYCKSMPDGAERVLGILLDSSIDTVLIVTASSHLCCQELLHASLMPTA